jgi:hypothetical protein
MACAAATLEAVRRVSLEVHRGELFALLGTNAGDQFPTDVAGLPEARTGFCGPVDAFPRFGARLDGGTTV